jgi:hypothetical protein
MPMEPHVAGVTGFGGGGGGLLEGNGGGGFLAGGGGFLAGGGGGLNTWKGLVVMSPTVLLPMSRAHSSM